MEINFVPFDEHFLQESSKWLQDEEIRMLIHASPFSAEQQQEWFEQLPFKKNYFIRGVECDHQPIGVVGLKHVTDTSGEYWGYIGEKDYWGKGIGNYMLQHIEEFGRERKLQKIYLNVLADNFRAIRSYEKNQFIILSEKQGMVLMEKLLT